MRIQKDQTQGTPGRLQVLNGEQRGSATVTHQRLIART